MRLRQQLGTVALAFVLVACGGLFAVHTHGSGAPDGDCLCPFAVYVDSDPAATSSLDAPTAPSWRIGEATVPAVTPAEATPILRRGPPARV